MAPGGGHAVWLRPQNTAASGKPTISGTAQVDELLTASTDGITDTDGLSDVSWSYQWLRGGTDIPEATAFTYTLTPEDEESTISVRVSFTDNLGYAEELTSDATGSVVGPPPVSGPAQVSFPENSGNRVATFSALSESHQEALEWTLSGNDQQHFTMDNDSGALRFHIDPTAPNLFPEPPDFEDPARTATRITSMRSRSWPSPAPGKATSTL